MQSDYQGQQENRLTFQAGEVIMDKVGQSYIMYAVESGEIHIEYDWNLIDVVAEGDIIGDIFATATIVAVTDCTLTSFNQA